MMNTKNSLLTAAVSHYEPILGTVVHSFYTDAYGDLWIVFIEPDGFTIEQPAACCIIAHGQYIGLPTYRDDLD